MHHLYNNIRALLTLFTITCNKKYNACLGTDENENYTFNTV